MENNILNPIGMTSVKVVSVVPEWVDRLMEESYCMGIDL